ncbi:MAG: winged helix-turn-helix domain-containing protein [Candidatus Kariarchaeaceae archaeon]|jgi:hypothetical protein
MVYSEQDLANASELYQRIENSTRKNMLRYIYSAPRTYSELMEFTQLKPGSLYHHLRVLDSLIVKQDHGLYSITDEGRKLVETLELTDTTRPKVIADGDGPRIEIVEQIDQILWLGLPNVVIIATLIGVSLFLGLQDIVIAGSAIYSVDGLALLFDLVAIVLGWFALYIIERLVFSTQTYHAALYALVIRVMMMLPAGIVGIVVTLIYYSGGRISELGFSVLFAITVGLGYILAVNGIEYLRGIDRKTAVNVAMVPSGIDLLIGIVILIA